MWMSVCRTCLGHNCSVQEKFELKRDEDVLEEMEKFCYMCHIISCYSGTSEAVNARIGIAWKKFRELNSVLVGKLGLSLKQMRRFISVVCDQFCGVVVTCGNLLLWMR